MKSGIHPAYDYVVFRDTSCGAMFLIRSTCTSNERITWEDGKSYPLINVEVSSASHPMYTGERRKANKEGRIARFNQRFSGTKKQLTSA